MARRVAILYGWAEGQRHGTSLRRELRAAGFSITRRPSKAEIIIAHSGGSLIIPRRTQAELVMLVGLPYWPGKHPLKSLGEKVRLEFKSLPSIDLWVKKTFYSGLYSLKFRHQYRIRRSWKKQRYPSGESLNFVAVRNQHDSFMHPERILKLAEDRAWTLVSLPGMHDDLWLNPKQYVQMLKSLMS